VVSLAKDGQEALEWLEVNPDGADIILMDIQMPEMDGYEATKRIRQDSRWRDIPILALTAGAFTADQETARKAGMDEFVTKPFSVDRLISVIRRLTSEEFNSLRKVAQTAHKPSNQFSNILDGINNQAVPIRSIELEEGIKRFGNQKTYFTYIKKFVTNYAKTGNEIYDLIRSGDVTAASALIHKLKGAAGNLALKQIYYYACRLEAFLISGSEIIDTDKLLQNAIDEGCQTITRLMEEKPDASNNTLAADMEDLSDEVDLLTLLEQFALALDEDSPAAVEKLLLQLILKLPSSDYALIQEKIDNFDFQSAKNFTRKLINKFKMD
jgi:CheY-like chemotaxis protein